MKPIIAVSLLVFWAIQFALQTVAAIKGMPLALLSPFEDDILTGTALTQSLPVSLLAVASGLMAALFAWAAVCAVAGEAAPGERSEDTARLAFAVAVAVVTVLTVLTAMRGAFVPFQPVTFLVAALAMSWMAVQRDLTLPVADTDAADRDSRQLAQQMAGEAAHKTMLGAISRRLPSRGTEAN